MQGPLVINNLCKSFLLDRSLVSCAVSARRLSYAEIARAYCPKDVEENPLPEVVGNPLEDKQKFRMILPPPNVTGDLHLGHAFMATIQDVICRHKRSNGCSVEWIPGLDHAGIATQVVVEKMIKKRKGISRHDMTRAEFVKEVWKWKANKSYSIINDLKRLGCSLDWSKEYFTLDHQRAKAVDYAFVRLFDEGLISRRKSLVNWSCNLESAISDIEVESLEIKTPTNISVPGYERPVTFGQIYQVSYVVVEGNEEISVSTTRPETMLGDVAVAVHPEDPRYSRFQGRPTYLWHPFRRKPIPLIFDQSVDPNFGTGAVKITPAHDKTDYEIAKRHSLECVEVFTPKGTIREEFIEYSGLPRFEARKKMLDHLVNSNLLQKISPHPMILPLCSRSRDVIEYLLHPQWFLNCTKMAADAANAVRSNNINIIPKNFETEWFNWLNNCHDWCISRQLWWGPQIPAYLARTRDNQEIWVAANTKDEAAEKVKHKLTTDREHIELIRDPDVLDTWFSSSLLPLSAFNWPQEEYRSSYPLDVIETGHDILFFWVARMVMMGLKFTGEVPFRKVLLNGILCDSYGRKMSKSIGNVITPEQVINGSSCSDLQAEIQRSYTAGALSDKEFEKSLLGVKKMFPSGIPDCGTDALRLTLCSHNIKNHFINFDVSECNTNKLFLNKIWQATRYTLAALDKLQLLPSQIDMNSLVLSNMDSWILSRLSYTVNVCANALENYNFHVAVSALKSFFYSNLCDVYLETTKPGIVEAGNKAISHCATLSICLELGLRTLSPICPFISKELLHSLPEIPSLDITTRRNELLEEEIDKILEVCQAIRQLKSRNNISKKHKPIVHIFTDRDENTTILSKYLLEIQCLCLTSGTILKTNTKLCEKDFKVFSTAGHMCSFGISTNDEYKKQDTSKSEINRKKLEKLENDLAKYISQTEKEGFRKSASAAVQKKAFEKIKRLQMEINNIRELGN